VLVCGHCYAFAWRVYEGGLLLISVEAWFLSQKKSGRGRGIKEKNLNNALHSKAVKDGIVSVTIAFRINNDRQDENLGHRSSIGPTVSASRLAFVPFATLLHGDSCRKGLNFRTLTKQARNKADVKLRGVLVTAFSKDGLSALATKLGTLLMLDSYTSDMCIQSWGKSSYVRALIKIRTDVELKDTIMVAMPKLFGKGFYTCTIFVEYE
nr:hypothetical protein [Tanacetum cinerariifolium]